MDPGSAPDVAAARPLPSAFDGAPSSSPWHPQSLLTLVVLAVGLGAAWRVEVEATGWASLAWVSAPHHVVPVGGLLVVLWTLTTDVAPTTPKGRGVVVAGGLALAAVTLTWLAWGLRQVFGRHMVPPDPAAYAELVEGLASVFGFAAFGAWFLGRWAGAPMRLWTLPLSMVLFTASIPLGAVALHALEPQYGGDLVHAVKTGAAVPFAVFGIGLPWTVRRSP